MCKSYFTILMLRSNAVDHWRSEFLRFSNISEHGITRATGEIKDEVSITYINGVLNYYSHVSCSCLKFLEF